MDSVAIEYRPDDCISKKFGPIFMAFPGHITYMSIEEAEELISKLQDAVSIAKEDAKEKELIEIDFDELSDAEIKVLLMMNEDGTPISPSRLQRIISYTKSCMRAGGRTMNDDIIAKSIRDGFDMIEDNLDAYNDFQETKEKFEVLFNALIKSNIQWRRWERENEGKPITNIPNPFEMVIENYYLEMEKRQ